MAALSLLGCSKFKSSRQMDMGPFAENTASMLVEAHKVVQPMEWNYLRPYRPEAVQDSLLAEVELVRRVFRGIGFYSIQVVALNNAKMSEKQRAAKLADYIETASQPIVDAKDLSNFGLTKAQLDSVLINIRAQDSYLGALSAADPLVYTITSFSVNRIDKVAATSRPAFADIERQVDAEFAQTHREIDELNALEEFNVDNYILLQDHRVGKAGSLDSLLARDPSLASLFSSKGKSSREAIDEAQRILQERLASIDSVRSQLGMRNEHHMHQIAELDEFRAELDERVRTAKLMLIYWMRSHANLAQGITVPPAINLESIAGSTAKKALKSFP